MQDIAQWPAGATYCAQGTVAEDATAGTHVCSLTVTPGAGNEVEFLFGSIVTGNTATATTVSVVISDGTNTITKIVNGSTTAANTEVYFPTSNAQSMTTNTPLSAGTRFIISGTMALKLTTGTAAISVTQTFAVACRTRGGKPSTVLADSVGAPVLTLNTDKLF